MVSRPPADRARQGASARRPRRRQRRLRPRLRSRDDRSHCCRAWRSARFCSTTCTRPNPCCSRRAGRCRTCAARWAGRSSRGWRRRSRGAARTPKAAARVAHPRAPAAPAAPAGTRPHPLAPASHRGTRSSTPPSRSFSHPAAATGGCRRCLARRASPTPTPSSDIDEVRDIVVVTPIIDGPVPVDWEHAEPATFTTATSGATRRTNAAVRAAAHGGRDSAEVRAVDEGLRPVGGPVAGDRACQKPAHETGLGAWTRVERDFRIRLQTTLREQRDAELAPRARALRVAARDGRGPRATRRGGRSARTGAGLGIEDAGGRVGGGHHLRRDPRPQGGQREHPRPRDDGGARATAGSAAPRRTSRAPKAELTALRDEARRADPGARTGAAGHLRAMGRARRAARARPREAQTRRRVRSARRPGVAPPLSRSRILLT